MKMFHLAEIFWHDHWLMNFLCDHPIAGSYGF